MKYAYKAYKKTVYNPNNGKYYSPAELDKMATQITNINPNRGSNKDRKHGRNKGRYIKGLL